VDLWWTQPDGNTPFQGGRYEYLCDALSGYNESIPEREPKLEREWEPKPNLEFEQEL
jgi:hypothetical protein